MGHALSNMTFVAVTVLACWLLLALVGLPFTLACLPRHRRWLLIPLSPLIAMALICGTYEYSFFLLFQPYRPLFVYGAIMIPSCIFLGATMLRRGERLSGLTQDVLYSSRRIWPMLIVPMLTVVLFSSFFAVNGLEMLSAGQDELAYAETARFIADHLFKRDAMDVPWGRYDHYLAEVSSRGLAYFPSSRLGAFFLLADFHSFFAGLTRNVSLETAFPLVVGTLIAIATASIAMLELLVRRSRSAVFAAQVAFACSWLLVMLHFQGSLSSLSGLGFRMGGLAFILWAVCFSNNLGSTFLAAVLAAGWLVLYHESIGFGLALPLGGTLLACSYRALRGRAGLLRRAAIKIGAIVLLTYILQPFLFQYTVLMHASLAQQNSSLSAASLGDSLDKANNTAANLLPPIIGYSSLYDDQPVNDRLTQDLRPYAPIALIGLAVITAIGLLRRLPPGPALGWALIPVTLIAAVLLSAARDNVIVLIRSAQMAMPHIFIGLSVLAFASHRVSDRESKDRHSTWPSICGRISCGVVWAALVALNAFSVVRTVSYINRYSQVSDSTVRHFDPDSIVWQRLRDVAASSDHAAVLLSGFTNTPIPYMIALGLGSVPHVAGHTITNFWTSIDPTVSLPVRPDPERRHWLSPDQLRQRLMVDPVWNWQQTYDQLLRASHLAIVPVSGIFPAEWGQSPSIGTSGWRFKNLCDVLERDGDAITIEGNPAAVDEGQFGRYWILDGVTRGRFHLQQETAAIIEVRFDGAKPRILLDGSEATALFEPIAADKSILLRVQTRVGPDTRFELHASPETRLRSIGVYRLPATESAGYLDRHSPPVEMDADKDP